MVDKREIMNQRDHWRAIAEELGLPSEPAEEAEPEAEEETYDAESPEEREESPAAEEPAWPGPWSAPAPPRLHEPEEPDAEFFETELTDFVEEEILVEPLEGGEEMAGAPEASEEGPRRGRRARLAAV